MKNKYLLGIVALLSAFSASGCSNNEEHIVIRVLNAADYIYEAEQEGYYCDECEEYFAEEDLTSETDEEGNVTYFDEEGHEVYYDADVMEQFVQYMDEKYPDKKFDYVYDTFDTPETCFNELKTGKSKYDVINVSDYMIQKMISNGLIQPLFKEESEQKETIRGYMSNYLWGEEDSIFNKITAPLPEGGVGCLADYSVPYMWGTIGLMYNYEFFDENADDEFSSWEVLYGDYAKGKFTIKDSVRDVYAVSVLHAYKDEITDETTNEEMNKIFNRCDDKTIDLVKQDMMKLKDQAFGFEVDSGKTDMVSGKIGANLAWSGDACWAIYEADSDYGTELAFQIPEEGSNIWFDAWCIPTVATHPEYALDLIEFMSDPEQAILNMDAVGYTTATAGDAVLDYVLENYESEDEEDYQEYDLSYFFEGSLEEKADEDAIIHAVTEGVQARRLPAQFPKEEQLKKLCVMNDFGSQNEAVLMMWQSVRTNPLPVWAVIIFALEGALLLAFILYYFISKQLSKKYRKMY